MNRSAEKAAQLRDAYENRSRTSGAEPWEVIDMLRAEAQAWASAPVGQAVPCREAGRLFLAIIENPKRAHN